MKKVIHLVNGILTRPGEAKNWNVEGVDWVHTHSDCYAVAIQYWAGPIDRVFGQTERANKLRDSIMCYARQDWCHILVGHSNGCDVIADCLQRNPQLPGLDEVHLVCAATEDDFQINGLNRALLANHVGRVTVYRAGQDKALKLANTWAGRFLGYGSTGPLGLCGPQNVNYGLINPTRVRVVDWPGWGHSECWSESNYDRTMGLFLPGRSA